MRKLLKYKVNGEMLTVKEISEKYKVSPNTVRSRIKKYGVDFILSDRKHKKRMSANMQKSYDHLDDIAKKCPIFAETLKLFGYRSVNQFCKANKDFNSRQLGELLNGKGDGYTKTGGYSLVAKKLCEFCGEPYERLFPDRSILVVLPVNLGAYVTNFNRKDDKWLIRNVLETLPERIKDMIIDAYYESMTLEEIGLKRGTTRERARQLIAKGLRMLRHPARCKSIRELW